LNVLYSDDVEKDLLTLPEGKAGRIIGDEDGDEPGEGGPRVEGETKAWEYKSADAEVEEVTEVLEEEVKEVLEEEEPGSVKGALSPVKVESAADVGESVLDAVREDNGDGAELEGLPLPLVRCKSLEKRLDLEVLIDRPESWSAFIRSAMEPPGFDTGPSLFDSFASSFLSLASTACILEVKFVLLFSIKSLTSFFTPLFAFPFHSDVSKTICTSPAAVVNAVKAPLRSPSLSQVPATEYCFRAAFNRATAEAFLAEVRTEVLACCLRRLIESGLNAGSLLLTVVDLLGGFEGGKSGGVGSTDMGIRRLSVQEICPPLEF
jgi:hypothetical protein